VFAACSHCPPLDPQNDQSLVAARFVPVNQVVQFELVDFSGIELGEAVTYVLEEPAQFIPVIATDELACGAPLGLIRRSALAGVRLNHGPNVRGELSLARDIGTYRATTRTHGTAVVLAPVRTRHARARLRMSLITALLASA
jgi:hypothetical protein